MKLKALKVLFFVNGPAPTAAQIVEAEAMNANVVFRNALVVPSENHSVEIADAVAGEVPSLYAAKYPSAEAAIEARAAKIAALSAKVGDEPAPVPPKGAKKAAAAAPVAPAQPDPADVPPKPPAAPASPAPASSLSAPAGWKPNA